MIGEHEHTPLHDEADEGGSVWLTAFLDYRRFEHRIGSDGAQKVILQVLELRKTHQIVF